MADGSPHDTPDVALIPMVPTASTIWLIAIHEVDPQESKQLLYTRGRLSMHARALPQSPTTIGIRRWSLLPLDPTKTKVGPE